VLERALAWAAQGWPVFPCNEDGTPAVKGWQQEATTDPDKIRGWFWDGRVACVPGLAGCFVIDVDVKNGKDGEASLARLEAEHDFEAWNYPQQETPSGGRHLFLRGEAPSSVQSLLGEGLDTRGGTSAGGLGFIYAYGDDPPCDAVSCPPGPESFRRILEKTDRRISEETQAPLVELDQPANIERALSFVRNLPSPGEGERNHTVFKTVCTMKDLGLSMAKVFEILEDHPSVTGTPPLCEENVEEFNATVRSAYKNGQLQPGIHAIDEEERNKAAEGFHVAEAEGQDAPRGVAGNRKHLGRKWRDLRDQDPPAWLIRDLLPEVSLVGLVGPGGAYKSFVALDLALAVASGAEEWAGRPISKLGLPVVYVSGEGAIGGRIRAWEARHPGVDVGDQFIACDTVDLGDDDSRNRLVETIDDLTAVPPALIVFDTFARATPGRDENSSRDMGEIVRVCDALKERYQCCVVLIHHTAKGSGQWRGSNAVMFALDTSLTMSNTRSGAKIVLDRQKDGETGQVWSVGVEEVETGKNRPDGSPERSLVVAIEERKDEKKPDGDKIASKARIRDMAVNELRAQTAIRILENMAPGSVVNRDTLLNHMQADLGKGSDRGGVRRFLSSVVKKGEVDGNHPLASYVSEINNLCFMGTGAEIARKIEAARVA